MRTVPTTTKPGTGTVLIVDDDENTLLVYARMLRLEGHAVFAVANAEDGLRAAERHRPDAVILDLRMPLMDGLTFLRRLRARGAQRGTPVAIVTGDYFCEDTLGADLRALGAEIQFKPLWLNDLVALVGRLLAGQEGTDSVRKPTLPMTPDDARS